MSAGPKSPSRNLLSPNLMSGDLRNSLIMRTTSFGVSMGAIVAGFAVALVMISITGASPGESIEALVDGAVGSPSSIASLLSKTVPLGLVALGWIVAAQAKRVNIGLEGQMIVGGATSAAVGLQLSGLPIWVHLPLAVLAGAVGGGAYAAIAALLWQRRGVNEIFSALMLNLIAVQAVAWVIRGPLAEGGASFARTAELPETGRWGRVVGNYVFSWDWVVLVAAVILVGIVLPRTAAGFRLRLVGANPEAATFAGVRTARVSVMAFVASGALAGLAGSSMILAGETYRMTDGFAAEYGYVGIVVALVAGNAALAVIPAALFFSFLRQGGGLLEARVGVPLSIVTITTGTVIVLLASASQPIERLRSRRLATEAARGSNLSQRSAPGPGGSGSPGIDGAPGDLLDDGSAAPEPGPVEVLDLVSDPALDPGPPGDPDPAPVSPLHDHSEVRS